MATAGRILIMPKGTWNAETTYENLDMVAHSGRAWLAKKTSVGIEPSDANAEFWHDFLGMDVFTEENPPTAAQVGALPIEGGGTVSNNDSVPMELKNTSDEAKKVFLGFRGETLLGYIGFNKQNQPVFMTSGGVEKIIHTEYTKPSGYYKGDGSITERTINVGGKGNLLHLWCPTYSKHSLVSVGGAFTWSYDGTIKVAKSNELKFIEGILTMASADYAYNTNDVYYYYELL